MLLGKLFFFLFCCKVFSKGYTLKCEQFQMKCTSPEILGCYTVCDQWCLLLILQLSLHFVSCLYENSTCLAFHCIWKRSVIYLGDMLEAAVLVDVDVERMLHTIGLCFERMQETLMLIECQREVVEECCYNIVLSCWELDTLVNGRKLTMYTIVYPIGMPMPVLLLVAAGKLTVTLYCYHNNAIQKKKISSPSRNRSTTGENRAALFPSASGNLASTAASRAAWKHRYDSFPGISSPPVAIYAEVGEHEADRSFLRWL